MSAALSRSLGDARLAQGTVRTELACARALLDELESVLNAQNEETTGCDVVLQVVDQLARVAITMKQSVALRGDERVVRGGVMPIGSGLPPEDDEVRINIAMTHGFDKNVTSFEGD